MERAIQSIKLIYIFFLSIPFERYSKEKLFYEVFLLENFIIFATPVVKLDRQKIKIINNTVVSLNTQCYDLSNLTVRKLDKYIYFSEKSAYEKIDDNSVGA